MSLTTARVAMVRPPRAVVARGVAPLRAEPDDRAELVDEAQYGEPVTCLDGRGEWSFVQGPDLYLGWIRTAHLSSLGAAPDQRVIAVPFARVRSRPADDAAVVDELPAGSVLFQLASMDMDDGGWIQVGNAGYVRADDTVETTALPHRYPTAADLLATAESFLGLPYLWGGTSAHGIDCSGFTQRVYVLNGVGLDRDADQQALGGRSVDRARPGDLFYFGADSVTHTALATGETTFMHAPQAGLAVQRGELGADRSRLRAIRRYLP